MTHARLGGQMHDAVDAAMTFGKRQHGIAVGDVSLDEAEAGGVLERLQPGELQDRIVVRAEVVDAYIIASANEASFRNAAKREALVRYSHGIGLALKAIASDRAALRAWADKWFEGLPPQIADVSFEINSRIFFQDPVPKPDLFQKNLDFINAVNRTMSAEPVPASITFDALFDPSVAREGMARL